MRWTSTEVASIQSLLEVDQTRRFKQRPFPASPKGTVVGGSRQDFRGYPLVRVVKFDVRDTDFSEAVSVRNAHGVDQGIVMSSCRCRDVSFDRAGPFHILHGIFDRCSFNELRTDHCGFTGLYRDCAFVGASLRGAIIAGDFSGCTFEGVNLRVDNWSGSSFSACRFMDCRVSPLFPEIRSAIGEGDLVSFSVLIGGTVKPNYVAKFSNLGGLLHGWENESGV